MLRVNAPENTAIPALSGGVNTGSACEIATRFASCTAVTSNSRRHSDAYMSAASVEIRSRPTWPLRAVADEHRNKAVGQRNRGPRNQNGQQQRDKTRVPRAASRRSHHLLTALSPLPAAPSHGFWNGYPEPQI